MLLTSLTVQNFGQFRDKHRFELLNKDGVGNTKPIILFGGKNGAGKTTLFEAFRLCLYGGTLPEFQLKKIDYHNYIRSRIHKSSKLVFQPVTAAISVSFEYARLGKIESYTIERRWHRKDEDRIEEQFLVKVDGKDVVDLEISQWQDFVKDLIPVGVSKLFFFDGEQIQALAQDNTDEIHLKDSFYSLLGLDLVDRLRSDLRIRLTKSAREADVEFGKELDQLERQLGQLEAEKEKILQENAQLYNTLELKKKKVTILEDKLAKEGGGFATKRERLREGRALLEAEIDQIYKQIGALCEGLLPFAIVPEYCISLKERILSEQKRQEQKITSLHVNKALNSVRRHTIAAVRRAEKNKVIREKMVKEIQDIFEHEISRSDLMNTDSMDSNIRIIHHLSSQDKVKILGWIDSVLEDIPKQAKRLSNKLESLTQELQRIGDQLNKAPSDDLIAPIIKELNALNQEIGTIDARISDNAERIKQIDLKVKHANVSIRELMKDKKRFEKLNRGLALAHRTQMALQEYEERLKKEKLDQLATSLIECLNELMHKEVFHKAQIDPDTFAVTLYDAGNNAIPKEQLSAGEKQIYAIAILWALARTSGRPLPFIVDTPLGRLDSDHRLNLVQNFFPVASHQVIIFSTDTEVDERHFEELHDYIARSYKLEYNKEFGMTEVEQGYFWRIRTTEQNEVTISK